MTDSTDPGAVTHEEARAIISQWAGVRTAAKLSRYIDQQESALTAMTARAEAAEVALDSWKLEARSLAADVVRCWEHGRLGSRDHAMYSAAKRIKDSSDGAHVARDQTTTPVEQSRSGPQCDAPCGSTGSGGEVSKDVIVDGKPDGAPGNPGGSQDGVAPTAQQPGHPSTGDPPPEPAPAHEPTITRNRSTAEGRAFWDSAEQSAASVRDWPDSRKAGVTAEQSGVAEQSPEPAPAGFAEEQRCDWCECRLGGVFWSDARESKKLFCTEVCREACRKNGWRRAGESDPAPQPAAAPKVLPVEELRREIAKAARRASHRGYIRDDGQNALQALAEELERGGEGKGG